MGTLVNVTRRWRRICVALSLSHSLVMIRPWDWEEMTWHLRKAIIIIYHSTNPLFPHRRSWDIFRCDAIQRHPALITLYFATKPHRWYWFCWFHASIPQLNPIVADAIISLWFKSIGVAKPQINALAKLVRRAICCVSRTPNRGPKHMSMRATIDAKQIRSRQRWFVVCHQCVNTRQSPRGLSHHKNNSNNEMRTQFAMQIEILIWMHILKWCAIARWATGNASNVAIDTNNKKNAIHKIIINIHRRWYMNVDVGMAIWFPYRWGLCLCIAHANVHIYKYIRVETYQFTWYKWTLMWMNGIQPVKCDEKCSP